MEPTAGFGLLSANCCPQRSPNCYPMTRFSGFMPTFLRVTLLVLLAFALSGCSWFGGGKKKETTETLPVEQMYARGKQYLDNRAYDRSARFFQRLVARFPFGPYSEQAQLELAYVLFKQEKHEDATSAIDRFIRTYPTHPHIDYAYYLKALINFDRTGSMLLRITRMEIAARELTAPTQSYTDFAEVTRRYPNSVYAADARQRLIYLRNLLARHELNIGLYYLKRGAYVSAINRGKYLLETFPQSMYQGDAIALMAKSYEALGQDTLAQDARKMLQANDPNHLYLTGNWPKRKNLLWQLNPFASGQ